MSSHADFVHLHLHTEYSLLDAACRLDKLMDRAHELKFPAIAITDHGVLYGAIDFYQAARAKGIKPIIGCEVYVAPGSRLEKKSSSGGKDVYNHLVLLAKDETGYKNLVKLVSDAHIKGYYYKPRIDKEILAAHSEGLISLSGCLASEICQYIINDDLDAARRAIDWFKQTLGPENFYLELQNHGIAEQAKVNRYLIPWAKEFGLKLVATNDVHYVEKGHSHAHDCLICIGTQSQLADTKRMRYVQEQFYLRSAEEMQNLFAETPEAVKNTREIEEKCNVEIQFNKLHYPVFHPPEGFTREGLLRKQLAEGLHRRYGIVAEAKGEDFIISAIQDPTRLPTYKTPSLTPALSQGEREQAGAAKNSERDPNAIAAQSKPNPTDVPPLPLGEGRGEGPGKSTIVTSIREANVDSGQLSGRAWEAHHQSSIINNASDATQHSIDDPAIASALKVVIDRLQMELKVIEKTGFISYFLIVADFVQFGRSRGISCVARGSAAGSIVTYLLEISNVDPIRYGLLFERFLNPERVNPPDIDIDFADDRRADVIEYVREKYGRDSVAQIITFGTMGAKSVVRDVGRVMGLSFGETDRLAKMIPAELKMSLEKALKQNPEFKQAYDSEEVTRELVDTAFVLEDIARNSSVHAAGVVIGDQPLDNLVPLKQDEDGTIVTQYAMGPVGDLGLLKMDFLGLKTLTVIRNTCELIKKVRGIDVPIDRLPLDDPKTYDLLNKANTVGVFQLESSGMRDLCRKFQISSVEHITALISLYRPGPMDLIPDFIKRRHGEVKIEYPHPLLEPITAETYGILIYQEQVMQAAQALAGYTLGGADLLRRAMGKKKIEEMAKERSKFVKGAASINKIPEKQANEIFDLLEKFAGYGFNKSHAAAYAIVSYQTAYLKANYPVEFLSAMLTNDMGDTDKVAILINEARQFNVEVLPPDINESQVAFAPAREGTVIRFGLAAVKGIGEVAVQNMLEARQKGGPFKSLSDLCERVDGRTVNKKILEALVKSGACDTFGQTRASLFAAIERTLARAASNAQDRQRGQSSLFDMLNDSGPSGGGGPSKGGPGRAATGVPSNNFGANDPEKIPQLPEWPQNELLAHEKELLGFYVTGHPLTPYVPLLEKYALTDSKRATDLPPRTMTRIGGLISAIQQGISKKSNKPYAMITLEDLHGTVQILAMNENYDKYRSLFEMNKAILVIGEVNNSEDRPKIFPTEIMALEDAPKKFTKQVHLRLQAAHFTPDRLTDVQGLISSFPGKIPLFLQIRMPTGEAVFIETHERFSVIPSKEFAAEADRLFGEETFYAKVDTSLPEPKRKAWEQRTFNRGDDE